MNINSLIVVFVFCTTSLTSQNLLIEDGGSVNINTNVSLNINGLELTPSSALTIVGPYQIGRSSVAITSGSNSSINRVFSASSPLTNFVGTLVFSYADSELNGLEISLLSPSKIWNFYDITIRYAGVLAVGLCQHTSWEKHPSIFLNSFF